jgi:capsule polysaccharide export protein KpsE/RkpR
MSLLMSIVIAFALPKRYRSSARIMPPNNSSASTAMLAALAGRAMGGLSGLSSVAGSLLGGYNSTAVVVDLLHSGTVANHLIDRFDLQRVYGKRYRVDAAKRLAQRTSVVDDKKSGAITVTVDDSDPRRARDMTQGYLDELNALVNRTSTSSAHQERVFIENRLSNVKVALDHAQEQLSEFSSTHATVDIKEQTRAMVDAASRLEAQRIVEQGSLDSLRQMYGEENVRVRAERARIGVLDAQISRLGGTAEPLHTNEHGRESDTSRRNELYPPLRQLPRLAVPYATLYRQVQVQENVFELLTQQYELARIQEAKDIPVVSVIDAPGIPEKKSFPPRLALIAVLTALSTACAAMLVLAEERWIQVSGDDARKRLALQIVHDMRSLWQARFSSGGVSR